MTNNKSCGLYKEIVTRILEGEGKAPVEKRHAAFENSNLNGPLSILINKVVLQPVKINDEDIEKLIASGFSEDQIFELVICSAVGESARMYESALEALSEAEKK
ncbi:MAG: hypothetical protein WCE54_23635 [Ignavibacteriaceae bacterium]